MNKTNEKRPYISVCISTYEMRGLGAGFLRYTFNTLTTQTFKDFEVVISDQSNDDGIRDTCDNYRTKLDIRYFRIPKASPDYGQNMPINTNNAILHARGALIKILFLDDFLYSPTSLEEIAQNFDISKDHWLITGCICTEDDITFFGQVHPSYHDKINLGRNTIGCPSVITIKNDSPLLLDPYIIWLMDGDYYKRYYDAFGPPKIVDTPNVAIRIGPHQTTNVESDAELRDKEYEYILKKYGHPKPLINIRQLKKVVRKKLPLLTRIYHRIRS